MNALITATPILINFVVSLLSILATLEISKHTINSNRKLNEENIKINAENAGKNRVIYATEQMDVGNNDRAIGLILNAKLGSGEYTILSAFVNLGNTSQTRYVLGRIKP